MARANQEGSVYRRESDGRWCATLSCGWEIRNGKPRRKRWQGYADTQREAVEMLAQARANLKMGESPIPPKKPALPPARQTVGDFLQWWLSEVVAKGDLRPRTRENYATYINHAIPLLGEIPLAELSSAHIIDLLAAKEAEGLAPRTRRHLRTVLRAALKWAAADDLLKSNPVGIRVPPPRMADREPHFLNADQARHLMDVAYTSGMGALITCAIYTGMRKGELLGLRWRDVSLDRRTLEVARTAQRINKRAGGRGAIEFSAPKTKSSRRSIHLSDEVVAALRTHRADQARIRLAAGPLWRSHDLIFTNQTGGPLDATHLHTAWKKLLQKAELPDAPFHSLRHSAASLMLHAGASLVETQHALGHASIQTTANIYAHIFPQAGRAIADKLSAILGRK